MTQQETFQSPATEVPVKGDDQEIVLVDGRAVPTDVVRALTDYCNSTWPGAVIPEARAAIAHVVISTIKKDEAPVLRTNYPFCLDDNPDIREKNSPCIKRSGHQGDHQDNNDGTWYDIHTRS